MERGAHIYGHEWRIPTAREINFETPHFVIHPWENTVVPMGQLTGVANYTPASTIPYRGVFLSPGGSKQWCGRMAWPDKNGLRLPCAPLLDAHQRGFFQGWISKTGC